jgi:class 3 adenylate cyclase
MMPPETRYARSGELRIAYQTVGEGPFDLVFVPGFVSNLDLAWEEPVMAHFFSRLANFSRLILFDKRGTGLSDRVAGIATLEDRMDDVRAVMDAAGSERAALFGFSEGGAMSILFTATHPSRVPSLITYGCRAGGSRPEDWVRDRIALIERSWGTGELFGRFAPSKAADEAHRRSFARWERGGASPAAMVQLTRMNAEIDIRNVLPAIHTPTLILHRLGDEATNIEDARYLAAHIAGAKLVELPGTDHFPYYDYDLADRMADEAEQFLTGESAVVAADRILATVLFTDIVDSTHRAAQLGDRQWQDLLDRHNQVVRRQIGRFRGQEVKTLGDGFLATFDGPARAVRCASAIAETVQPLGIAVRAGLHTGEIEFKGDDVAGIAVSIAARVAAKAGPNETVVSRTVRDLVAGSGLRFEDRGSHVLHGLPEHVQLYTFLPEARTPTPVMSV